MLLTITCVWAMILMTLQYFFILLKSFSISFLPCSSCHFLAALVKAFFLERYLQVGPGTHQRMHSERNARAPWCRARRTQKTCTRHDKCGEGPILPAGASSHIATVVWPMNKLCLWLPPPLNSSKSWLHTRQLHNYINSSLLTLSNLLNLRFNSPFIILLLYFKILFCQ